MELLYTDENGVVTKYTEDMLINAVKQTISLEKENSHHASTVHALNDTISTIRGAVYDFFNDRYSVGEETIECSVSDVNELLEHIGSMKLKRLFTVSGRIDFTITGIEAEDSDDAECQVVEGLSYDWSGEGDVYDFDVSVNNATEED